MKILALDHVNIRTQNLKLMTQFYEKILNFYQGNRPKFTFKGAWLYCGEHAAIHLVETKKCSRGRNPQIDHIAFRCEELEELLIRLRKNNHRYSIQHLPDRNIYQVFTSDPDGNALELQFKDKESSGNLTLA